MRPSELTQFIRESRRQAALAVHQEMIVLFWGIGREILVRQERGKSETQVIDRLTADLYQAFPEKPRMFSACNLRYMRVFAEAWPDIERVYQLAAQLPWDHHKQLLDTLDAPAEREWYACQAIIHGWSVNVLSFHIQNRLMAREAGAPSELAARPQASTRRAKRRRHRRTAPHPA